MVSIKNELIKATIKKISGKTKDRIKKILIEKGENAAINALAVIISSKTGLSNDRSKRIAKPIVRGFSKAIRAAIKRSGN